MRAAQTRTTPPSTITTTHTASRALRMPAERLVKRASSEPAGAAGPPPERARKRAATTLTIQPPRTRSGEPAVSTEEASQGSQITTSEIPVM